MKNKIKFITRYAPSPTGYLHIGGTRTALFCYLSAKSRNGIFFLRNENTDTSRNIDNGINNQLDGLKWLGIMPDNYPSKEGIFKSLNQADRIEIYNKYIDELLEKKIAYKCWCTSEELEKDREKQLAQGIQSPQYNKKCLHNPKPKDNVKPSIRINVPNDLNLEWEDGVRGKISVPSSSIGDWIIRKSDGMPTYNFSNVIDDNLMNVTEVHRGEEHISNTPKQLHLYKIFGWEPPKFYHLTIIIGEDNKKLSKRDNTVLQFIDLYKEYGYHPKAVLNFLALLGWSPEGEREIFSKEELIKIFDETRYSKSPSKFDLGKLKWFNNHYINQLSDKELYDFLEPFLTDIINKKLFDKKTLIAILKIFQPGLHVGNEIVELIKIFIDNISFTEAEDIVIKENKLIYKTFIELLNNLEDNKFNYENIKLAINELSNKLNLKGAKLLKPIRLILTNKDKGPDLASIINIYGKKKTIERLNYEPKY